MIRKNRFKILTPVFLILLSLAGCTEEIDVEDEFNFEDVIVIEATLTNEKKIHQILISRSFRFDDEEPRAETNAQVQVIANESETIAFTEQTPGVYESSQEFAAEAGVNYQLFVSTNDGKDYQSPSVQLAPETQIDDVYASREVNSIGNDIMSIFVDSFDPTRSSNYYRYEYEETYKIIAPDWTREDFLILQDGEGNDLPVPGFTTRPLEEQTCYNTVLSNSIIQTSTTNLTEDRVAKFSVRNIASDDPIISHRYSILVKQFVQSQEAFSYYDILNQLSGSNGALNQIQPGFISSNIRSTVDRNEKVLGFFQVSSMTEKRIFFNYEDFYPGEPLPPYFTECGRSAPPISAGVPPRFPLLEAIQGGLVKYLTENLNQGSMEGPYIVVPTPCGDCTILGTSEEPDFWED